MGKFNTTRGPGGTPGGLGEFIIGTLMIIVGGYLFFSNLVVLSTFSSAWNRNSSGLALIAMVAGIGILFFSRRAWIGWLLIGIGGLLIMVHVITNLTVLFRPTSLLNTLLMLSLIAIGLGLVARALRPH